VDTSYTGEFGIREVIDKSMDVLMEIDIMREKKLVQRFLKELVPEEGLASYGEADVRKNLEMGAVEVLLLSEGVGIKRETCQCPACAYVEGKTLKKGEEVTGEQCPKCGEIMKVTETKDIIDEFVDMAEEVGSDVEIVSTETEEGMQLLRAFGGIAAVLRYRT